MDVATGLIYVHGEGMIHGDLKGVCRLWLGCSILPSLFTKDNILIDQTGHARLGDFGLLTVISDPTNGLSSTSSVQGGTLRWMGPELLDPQRFGFKKIRPTESSDCYALGMVIYETISGHAPFYPHHNILILGKVLGGEHPCREAWFTDSLWKMLELCWQSRPTARPSVEQVLRHLEMEPTLTFPRPTGVKTEDSDDSDIWKFSCKFSHFTPPWSLAVFVLT